MDRHHFAILRHTLEFTQSFSVIITVQHGRTHNEGQQGNRFGKCCCLCWCSSFCFLTTKLEMH